MIQGIVVLLSTLVVVMLMGYLTKLSYKDNLSISNSKAMRNEKFILRYNKFYRVFGNISFIAAGIFGVLPLTGVEDLKDNGDIIAYVFLIGLFAILGILIMFTILNVKIEVSDNKIKYWNIFNKSKEILWDDIKKVECSKNHHELKLITNKKSITVHAQMIGFISFRMRMMKKLDKAIYEEALKKVSPF